jgi:hypothetical protein
LEQTDVSEALTAFITTHLMEKARTSETSVYSNETTWRYIPEGSHLHTRRRENLKSHISETFRRYISKYNWYTGQQTP